MTIPSTAGLVGAAWLGLTLALPGAVTALLSLYRNPAVPFRTVQARAGRWTVAVYLPVMAVGLVLLQLALGSETDLILGPDGVWVRPAPLGLVDDLLALGTLGLVVLVAVPILDLVGRVVGSVIYSWHPSGRSLGPGSSE